MKKSINFILGLHSHQPVGNFESIFEEAFQLAYKPFLEVFYNHPEVKITLHYTGVLFEWIMDKHPDYIEKLKEMIQRGQVEMMTGAYFEPILPIVPDQDKIGQIKKLTQTLKEVLEVEPKGMWLAERVWEPHLPKFINQAGASYTVVDDYHFKSTGLSEIQTLGYYITEELGNCINIFPISEKMRYTIPFKPPEDTIEYLASMATEDGTRIVVMADDGEKFGVWPETHKHVYKNGWLEHFLKTLSENRDWINCISFSEAITKFKPVGRVYLPTASYIEMMEWVMPPHTIHQYENFVENLKKRNEYQENKIFVRGGFWRNYFAKYPESNQIHKKMLFVSEKIRKLEGEIKGEKQKEILEKAKDCLWRGQCNCGYWHGVFGGLYLPHLRKALFANLVQADSIAEKIRHKTSNWFEVIELDFDADGNNEVIYQSEMQNLYFKISEGAMIVEHDFIPANANLIDTLARREEAYHTKVSKAQIVKEDEQDSAASIHDIIRTKELGLEKFLNYDWYRRASLIDHFLGEWATLENFSSVHYPEDGDFVNQPYLFVPKKLKNKVELLFIREGAIYQPDSRKSVKVEKKVEITPDQAGFVVYYKITNLSHFALSTRFGVEFNINFQAGSAPDRYYFGKDILPENNFITSR